MGQDFLDEQYGKNQASNLTTVCPRSSDPFYTVTYYIEWVTTSWTDGNNCWCAPRVNIPLPCPWWEEM